MCLNPLQHPELLVGVQSSTMAIWWAYLKIRKKMKKASCEDLTVADTLDTNNASTTKETKNGQANTR